MTSVYKCIAIIGVEIETLESMQNIDDEFKFIKRSYFKMALVHHPDKGGDAANFRELQTAFDFLRDRYDAGKIGTFAEDSAAATADESRDWEQFKKDFNFQQTPDVSFFEAAAEEPVPPFKIEKAKSGRSRCASKLKNPPHLNDLIEKNSCRIGSLTYDPNLGGYTGTYGQFVHLTCWRVPSKIWLGLPDPENADLASTDKRELKGEIQAEPSQIAFALKSMNSVLLVGFEQLDEEIRAEVVEHVSHRENWAAFRKPKSKPVDDDNGFGTAAILPSTTSTSYKVGTGGAVSKAKASSSSLSSSSMTTGKAESSMVEKKKKFIVPAVNEITANSLKGKTFVLTGTFPELGGGAGLNLGKEKAKTMIEKFGGSVKSAISGQTDILLVGTSPGMSKVSKGRAKAANGLVLMKTEHLQQGIESGKFEDLCQEMRNAESLKITSFSGGAFGNSLAIRSSTEELMIATGEIEAPQDQTSVKRKDNAKPKKRTKTEPEEEPEQKVLAIEYEMTIICDSCGVDCSPRSFFVEKPEEMDLCPDCMESSSAGTGAEQTFGVNIPVAVQPKKKKAKRGGIKVEK